MCGIFGHINSADGSGALPRDVALSCLSSLSHRGPDGWGLEELGRCTLGHRRLSILDTSQNGRQPMFSPCRRYSMVYNGEVYNYLEIRKELEARGHCFRTGTDTEVVLAAYMEYGPACLDRFNGMWSLGIWDSQEYTLFLARDRFGKKPLFWADTPYGFAFASEMKALMPLLKTVEPNAELIRTSRRIMSYEATEDCLVLGIHRFPAGHYALTRGNGLTPVRWWNTLDTLQELQGSYAQHVERFAELFLDACTLRMRSDVPLGTALSGGLDSSATICAMAVSAKGASAAYADRQWQNAFTASFPGTPLDETEYARMVTDHLGISAVTLNIDPAGLPSTLYRDLWLFEELHLTPPTPFMRTYEAVREHGVKVTLDGHGADELFAGYGFDFLHGMHDAPLWQWPGVAQTYRNCLPDAPQFPKPGVVGLIAGHLRNRKNHIPPAAFASPDDGHPAWRAMGKLNRILYHSFHRTVLPTLLRNYDRYSMAAGVEIRMPFMDYRIVSLAFSLAWNAKLRNGFTKSIVRDGVQSFVPAPVVWRKTKIGFNAPTADWIRGPLREFFLDTVNDTRFRESVLADQPLAAGRLHDLLAAGTPTFAQAEACWTAFVPYFWEQAVLHRQGAV